MNPVNLGMVLVTALTTALIRPDETVKGVSPKPAPAPQTGSLTNSSWAKPEPAANPDTLGRGIQRTMRLLATSTPTHHNHVRILFYGQSITEQKWTELVTSDLKKRFPYADLEIENRAIGGFASSLLIRPAEHDVYPFNPDLVIFHVYGSNKEYEEIIHSIRSRTTAEVLMQRDHVAADGVDPGATRESNKGLWWDNFMNYTVLPQVAQKYGCGLADVRGEWLRYLKTNKLEPKALLIDGVHLNEQGCYVMAQIVQQSLIFRPDLPSVNETPVHDYRVGSDVHWKGKRLVLEFTGNRVELLPGTSIAKGNIQVLIDGKAPSAHPECYAITRPQPNPWASPLSLSRVDSLQPLLAEDWTLKVTQVQGTDPKTVTWTYTVSGSLTGEDGTGQNDTVFTSRSGRVKIEPESFFRGFSPVLTAGHTITWRSYLLGTDKYTISKPADLTKENAVLLAGGLSNGKHTLELVSDTVPTSALATLRVFHPGY